MAAWSYEKLQPGNSIYKKWSISGFDCTTLICKEVSQGNGVPANRITKITQFLSPGSCCLGQIS